MTLVKTSNENDTDVLGRIVTFLQTVGVPLSERQMSASSLLPGVAIESGQLVVDRSRVEWPGDLLHEAGHLAVVPARLRPMLSGTMSEEIDVVHAGEPEATAWAYAAIVALGLEPDVLFHVGGYHGHSRQLAFTYAAGCFPGAGGLCAAGMALGREEAERRDLPPYPHMIRWLRE